MKFQPVTVPSAIAMATPGLTWKIPTDNKILYLSFDDGPTPEVTPWVLDLLTAYNAKATFFCVGANVKKHPEIYNDILNRGHAVGNHSFSHLKGWTSKTKDYVADVKEAAVFINSKLFRPPYGQIKPKQIKQLKKLDYKIIMWSILSLDWDKEVSESQCLKNVIENAKAGNIIVFHDSLKADKNMRYALEGTLKHFAEKGFEFKRIPE